MSEILRRLYQLDSKFAQELEKLLQNDKDVGELLRLPEKELIQFMNYLNDVSFPPAKSIQLVIASIDPRPFRSHWHVVQKMFTCVAEDMWYSKSSPHRLRRFRDPFVFYQNLLCAWGIL